MNVILTASLLLSSVLYSFLAVTQNSSSIPKVLVDQFFRDLCPRGCSKEEVALWKANFRYEARDLNGDSVHEWFLHVNHSDWCGAGSNCDYSVYQKSRKGYRLLLSDKVLVIRDTVTNGYRDVESEGRMGVCGDGKRHLYVTLYKYDGKKYRSHGSGEVCRE